MICTVYLQDIVCAAGWGILPANIGSVTCGWLNGKGIDRRYTVNVTNGQLFGIGSGQDIERDRSADTVNG